MGYKKQSKPEEEQGPLPGRTCEVCNKQSGGEVYVLVYWGRQLCVECRGRLEDAMDAKRKAFIESWIKRKGLEAA